MFEVTYVLDGVQRKMSIRSDDIIAAMHIFTNMYGTGFGNIQIINIRRI